MAILEIDELQAGMVLASDLKGSGGRMLLPAGVALQQAHLKTLKAWGISAVDIQLATPEEGDESPQDSPEALPLTDELLEQSRNYLLPLFALTNLDHPAMAALFQSANQRLARQLAGGGGLPELPWDDPALSEEEEPSADLWRGVPKKAETLMRAKVELASLPDVYSQIVEVLNSPRSSAAHLAEMVSKDTSLSGRLLKLVNSVFYGLPTRVDSISRAITLIGTNELTTLALGISVVNAFKDIPAGFISMEGFWRHAIACGIFARLLAAQKVGVSDEQMFVGGLLHDIGRMVMLKQIPRAYSEIVREARQQRLALYTLEKRRLTYDHMDVGVLLCREWNFSKALEEMIGCHHYPGRGRYAVGCSIIHLADLMAKIYFVGQGSCGCVMISPLQEKVWESLTLSPEVLSQIFVQADRQINDVVRLFLGEEELSGKGADAE